MDTYEVILQKLAALDDLVNLVSINLNAEIKKLHEKLDDVLLKLKKLGDEKK